MPRLRHRQIEVEAEVEVYGCRGRGDFAVDAATCYKWMWRQRQM